TCWRRSLQQVLQMPTSTASLDHATIERKQKQSRAPRMEASKGCPFESRVQTRERPTRPEHALVIAREMLPRKTQSPIEPMPGQGAQSLWWESTDVPACKSRQ